MAKAVYRVMASYPSSDLALADLAIEAVGRPPDATSPDPLGSGSFWTILVWYARTAAEAERIRVALDAVSLTVKVVEA
jgi:hypothetical protein